MDVPEIGILVGKTMKAVTNNADEELVFETTDGEVYKFYHSQDCCESVRIEDIDGHLADLVGEPLTMAEEISGGDPPDWKPEFPPYSYTWTFYKFATKKGYVTVRWFGESNGYYSESVDFCKM